MTADAARRRAPRTQGIGELGPRGDPTTTSLSTRRISQAIWATVAFLILATFVAQFMHVRWGVNTLVDLFDSDQKLNFPSALKILLLLSATGLFAAFGRTVHDQWHRSRWLGMSAVFAMLTLDEMTYMHQRLSDTLHDLLGTTGPIRFAWILVYLPLVAGLAIVYWPFWRKLADPFRMQLLVAAIAFGGGSGGIEFVKSQLFDEHHWKLTYGLVASISDSLELLGLALLVTALLTTLRGVTESVNFSFDA